MLYIAFFILILGWSYTAVVTKIALNYISPVDLTFWRVLIGFFFLAIICFATKKITKPKSLVWAFWLGLFQNALPVIFYNLALLFSNAGKVTVLGYTMPFWTIIFEKLVLKTKLERFKYIPILLSFLGLLLIMQPWQIKSSLWGYFFAILYGVSWGFGNIISLVVWKKYPNWDVISLTFWQTVFVLIIVALFYLFYPQTKPIFVNNYLIFAILYTGIISTAFAWYVWILLLKKLPSTVVSSSSLAIPILAIFESYIQLHEKFNSFDLMGSFFIILSLAIIYVYSIRIKSKL